MTTVHKPKTEIGKKKFEIAEALNTITDLQNSNKNKELTAEQRYQLFNTSMRTVCDLLDIDLDMHELLKTGSEGFSYSDSKEDTDALQTLLNYTSNSVTCVHRREIQNKTDQEVYDNLPVGDKLNVDMLNKLHEVQDYILESGQTNIGVNRITTATSILEASLGVLGEVEE
ncbi:hypothetical protein VNN32_03420 [Lactococcus petauri]|uniref:hypothetical protein n=1 Tax=Lactococcus petauri TaxID=1940789 RepID=UPI0030D404D7